METKGHILIVEDDEAIREALQEILTSEGYQVRCAENGAIALERLVDAVAGAPDLILLDLTMPVMNGQSFLGHLRSRADEIARTPVLVLTAAGKTGKPPAADGFLRKPLQLGELLDQIEIYCQRNKTASA